jgi:Domain of unknown function (DUF1905)
VIELTATLWRWSGEGGSWHFITIPEEISGEFRAQSLLHRGGFGSVRVEASIGDVTWRTSVFPQKSGGYILPVKADVRKRANIDDGDEVNLKLEILEA